MARLIRIVVVALLAVPPLGVVGCGNKEEGKPNPDFQVPDIAAKGSKEGKGDMSKEKKK